MKYSNSIEYNISTKLDSKGITQLKTELQNLELKLQNMGNKGLLEEKTFSDARDQIHGLGDALTEAFNPSLGMLNLAKFNQELKNNGVTAQGLKTAFGQMGAEGQVAFNNLIGQLGKLDTGIIRTSSQLDKMFVTFQNTFRWGLISSFFSQFMNAIHSSVEYAKELDDSLTQIMLVTDYSRDSMNEYAKAANEAAKAVGQTTVGMTNASLIFAQQGYDLNQSQQLATLSAKLANASQQDTAATSDQITAYMNAYGLQDDMEALSQAMDNWALIANISAADVEEIALASQRAASMANAVGVSGEALAAQIATIESVTREAPEQIGNGLKTLYARFSDLQLGKEDEDGIGLGKVTSTLQNIGVQVLDSLGNVRNMDDIMEDLMVIWQDLDDTTQEAVAQTLAGKHQVNRFTALMDNSDMYQEYLGATGINASGTLEQMNQEYLDSLEGRTAKLQATLEGLFNDVFTTDMVYPLIDTLTKLAEVFDTLFKSVGGGSTVILGLASAFTQLFSKHLAQSINDFNLNQKVQQQKIANLEHSEAALTNLGMVNPNPDNQYSQNALDFAKYMQVNAQNFSPDQLNQANTILQELIQNGNAATIAAEKLDQALSATGVGIASLLDKDFTPFLSEGIVNVSQLMEKLKELSEEEKKDLFANLKSKLEPAKEGLLEFNKALQEYQNQLRNAEKSGQIFSGSTQQLEQSLEKLKPYLSGEQYTEYNAAIKQIGKNQKEAGTQTAALTGKTARLIEELERLSQIDLKKLDQANLNQLNTDTAAIDSSKLAESFKQGMSSQDGVQQIINIVGALGQLSFAMQSLSNLPSIWNNADLTTGEKLLQIVTNLSFSLPTLYESFKRITGLNLSSVFQNLKGIDFSSISKIGELQDKASQAMEKYKEAQERVKNASENLTKAQAALADAQKSSGASAFFLEKKQIGVTQALEKSQMAEKALKDAEIEHEAAAKAVTAAETAKATAIQLATFAALAGLAAIVAMSFAYQKWSQEQQRLLEEQISASDEYTASLKDGLKNIDKLYESWKQTGEGADELRQALEEQAEALEVVVTAADDYETLRQKIEEATAAQLNYNAVLRGQNTEATEYDFSNAYRLSAEDRERLGIETTTTTHRGGGRGAQSQRDTEYTSNNPAEMLQTAKEMREETANQLLENQNRLMREANTLSTEDYQNLLDNNTELERRIGLYDTIIQQNQDSYDYNKQTVETAVQANALSKDSALREAQSYEEIIADLQIIDGFSGLVLEDQIALAQQAAEWTDNLNAAAEAQMALAEYQVSQNGTNSWGAQKGDRGLAMIDTLSDQYDLTAEQKASVVSLIDWSDPEVDTKVAELLRQIREGLENGISIDDILAGTGNGLNTDPKEYLSTITSSDSDVDNETLQDTAKAIYEYNDQLAEYADDIEDFPSIIKEAAEAQVRYNKAVERTVDNIDDWKEVLEDLENANPEDLAKTTKELRNTYEDLLDLDTDSLSDAFIVDPDNLESLEAAINGDIDAYWDLWEAAQTDILIQAGMDDTQAYEAAANLRSILYDNGWDDIEIGASLSGEEELLAAFEDIINAAGMTADQAQQYLSSMGVDAEVKEESEITEDEKEAYGWRPVETGGINVPVSAPVKLNEAGTGLDTVTGSFHIGGFRMEPVPMTDTATSTTTALSMKTTSGGYSSGGNLHINRSTARKTGGSGSQKRSGSAAPRSSGGGGSCFIAGTLVSLQNSFKEIEKIQVGDIVLSYNEENHQNEYSRVLQTMIHNTTEEIYDLYIEDETLSVTGIHRFYIRRKHDIEWIMASELNIGDYVLFADGNWHVISNINVKIQTTTVYNFEVSDNHNYYVGHNQILAHNKGGGGGGGKAKTIQPKEKKEHKKNYYEKVDSQLDKLKEQLSGIEKQEDKLIGDKARANQQKQINLIQQEIKLEEERLKILQDTADSELKDVKAAMEAKDKLAEDILKGRGINFNIPAPEYDENGIITNYETISAKIDEAHNKLIDQYNAAAAAGNEDLTKTIDEAIKKYDDYSAAILENAQRQNDIQKEIESTKNKIQELKDSITDINIELYKTSMEAIDNLKDLNEKWAEFQGFLTGMPSDSPFRELTVDLLKLNTSFEIGREDAEKYYQEIINGKLAAQDATDDIAEKEAIQASINYFTGLKEGLTDDRLKNGLLGLATTDLEQLEKWYRNDPTAGENPFGDNQKALAEAYQEGYERVLELSQDWQDLQEDIVDTVIDGFDEIADKQDRQLEKYERLAEELENLADIYALSYGDESYKALSDINKRQAETLKAQLGQYVNIYKYWQKKYQEALDTGNEELANSIEDRMNDVQDEMRDIAQESAETFVEAYENAIDAAVQQMYNATIREDNLDHINQNWEWNKKIVDNYRDEVEKTFEIEQLRSKYNDLLNDAQGSSLATQNKIRKQMQEQLDLLKNQESMSEYDVELANSKLLILQKQIALEDAQQNKNQMQLRRDSQGNYRYVYRANQNDIAKARQEYMQAVQDAYELTKEQRQKTAEELGNTLKDYASQWADLNKNMNLTEEERIKQSRELTEKFLNYMKHLNEDLADSQLGMSDVLNFMVENGTADIAAAAQEMLGQLFDDQGNLIENTDIAWWDFGNNLAKKLFPYIQDATSTMNDTLKTEAEELRNKLTGPDGVITDVKKALIDEETGLRPALEDAANAITGENGLNNAMDSLTDSFKNQNEKLTEGMNNIKKYTEELAAAVDWLSKAQEAINDLQKINTDNLVYETKAPLPEDAKPAEEKPTSTSTSTMESATTKKTFPNGSIAGYKGSYYGNSWGGGGFGNSLSGQANKIRISSFSRGSGYGSYNIHIETLDGGDLGWIKEDQLFDTGGYTGEWGKDGRLAVLHQKELVLNAQDTRNILSAVDIVRQMTSTLGSALTNYSSSGMKANFMSSAFGGTVDQRVEIKAEFPNVKDSFEIETALTNLADTAYQYAHRKI